MKIPLPKINLNKIGDYLFTIIVTTILICAIFITIPRADKALGLGEYNLVTKDSRYWKRTYTLEVQIPSKDLDSKRLKIEETKNILQKRLNSFGVEEVKIQNGSIPENPSTTTIDDTTKSEDTTVEYIQLTVQTTEAQGAVEALIYNRNYIRIVIPKEGVDFNDPDNPLAAYDINNYEKTDFTRHDFRTIYIKKLDTTAGGKAYFAIYKSWPHTSSKFKELLAQYAGRTVGIATDGFVTQYTVPIEFDKAYLNSLQRSDNVQSTSPEFAPPVSQDSESAKIADLLYNSGVIPEPYSVINVEDLKPDLYEVDYEQVAIALIAGTVAIMIFSVARNKQNREENIRLAITTTALFTLWISILKLTGIPTDLFILIIEGFILLALMKVNLHSDDIRLSLSVALFFAITFMLSSGYTKIISRDMMILALGAWIITTVITQYLNKMKTLLTR